MNRFDRSCIRSFFTLPKYLLTYPNSKTWTERGKPFKQNLSEANAIQKNEINYYIIWLDDPAGFSESDRIDLSFRDFSAYQIPPYVLIRKSTTPPKGVSH